jgi:hypothetical protein
MVKRTRESKRYETSKAAAELPAAEVTRAAPDWNGRASAMWSAPLREQLQFWVEAWIAFQAVAHSGELNAIDAAPDWMQSATTLARCSMLYSGESQAESLGKLYVQLAAMPHGFTGFLNRVDPERRSKACAIVKKSKVWPEAVMMAGASAEKEVRRVLDEAHLHQRLRLRPTSLLARLAVTVFRNGGVLMKQKAHLLHTGRDRKPANQLEKLMTPRGKWATAGLGSVDGDYLRLSNSGRDQAARLVDLGVAALGSPGTASGN